MNVVGISTAPSPVVAPVIPRVPEAAKAEAHPQQHQPNGEKPASAEQPRPPALKEPPVKPLSTTEMRVFLGGLPLDALFDGGPAPKKGSFDGYA
ncbi:MAG: hypothetical protein WAL50_19380 [Kineosporiaceae bacterium]